VTDASPADPAPAGPAGSDESEPTGIKITDKRRLEPLTGAVRDVAPAAASDSGGLSDPELATGQPGPDSSGSDSSGSDSPWEGDVVEGLDVHPDTTLAADLTRDLQRLQAEYVNYKRRVDRDRELHRDVAVGSVIEALLPVMDDIHLARQHGDLEAGPFAAIADKLEGTLTKFGVERFGQPGDAFDPTFHEALMHTQAELAEGTEVTTVVQVMQPGYKMGERLIRPARVAVADPL
jgi:molecular chaperone GrpE